MVQVACAIQKSLQNSGQKPIMDQWLILHADARRSVVRRIPEHLIEAWTPVAALRAGDLVLEGLLVGGYANVDCGASA